MLTDDHRQQLAARIGHHVSIDFTLTSPTSGDYFRGEMTGVLHGLHQEGTYLFATLTDEAGVVLCVVPAQAVKL